MKSLKVYMAILYDLVVALFQLGYGIVRQVVLPTCKRKGNLLSSLFMLFTGLVENLINFGESFERIPCGFHKKFIGQAALSRAWTYSQRYLRQGMLIATWALFILSSIEWTEPRQPSTDPTTVRQEVAAPAPGLHRQRATAAITVLPVPSGKVILPSYPTFSPRLSETVTCHNISRWLMLCTLRI